MLVKPISNQVNSTENLQNFARLLIIAKGVDFDSLDSVKQEQLWGQILEIYLEFVDQNLSNSKNQETTKLWLEYKNSNFDPNFLNQYPLLSQYLSKLTEIFIQIK